MDIIQTTAPLPASLPPRTHNSNPAKEVPFESQGHFSHVSAGQRRALPFAVTVSQAACADSKQLSCHRVPQFPMAEDR